MDDLMSSRSSMAAKAGEKMMEKEVGKDTMCPQMTFRVRFGFFIGLFSFGKAVT